MLQHALCDDAPGWLDPVEPNWERMNAEASYAAVRPKTGSARARSAIPRGGVRIYGRAASGGEDVAHTRLPWGDMTSAAAQSEQYISCNSVTSD